MERARLEATKKNELAERDVAERKDKADTRALHKGARKLAIPDVRRLLTAHFGNSLTSRCSHQPCANRVNAAKAWIVAQDDYIAGMDDLLTHASVVCPTHAKHSPHPVRHLYSLNPRLVEMWLFRVGSCSSQAVCGVCGICVLQLWGDVDMCHVVPIASGGSGDEDNIFLGSPACNRQQGGEDLVTFAHRISSSATAARQLAQRIFPKAHLRAAREELMSCSAHKVGRDAVTCMRAAVARITTRGRSRQSALHEALGHAR